MIKRLFLIFGIIFLFSFVGAVTLNQGIILNSSVSNSSVNFSFNINVSNFTVESNYVSLIGINFTNSTGSYTCDEVNHSTANSIVDSSEFNCSLVVVQSETTIETNPSGGSTRYWFGINEKENRGENKLTLTIGVGKADLLNKEIKSNITGLREIEITAKERIYGNIEVKVLKEIPSGCNINESYDLYEIFEINENFNISNVESMRFKYGVDKNWIKDNGIKDIRVVKCLPYYELLKIEEINESEKEEYFNIYSNSFSTWAVLGIREELVKENNLIIKNDEREVIRNNFFEDNWYWGLLLIPIFIIIFFGLKKKVKKRIKRRHKH